jgi:hypothetical protein
MVLVPIVLVIGGFLVLVYWLDKRGSLTLTKNGRAASIRRPFP